MENLLLSPVEQKLVLKSKNFLERKYNVNINLPDCVSTCERDVVVATIHGAKINLVKNFIQKRMGQMKRKQEQRITVQNNVTTITLSDSDSDGSLPVLKETQQKGKKKQKRKKRNQKLFASKELNDTVDLSSTILVEDSEESADEDPVSKRPKDKLSSPVDFIPLNAEKENTLKLNEMDDASSSSKNLKVESLVPPTNFMSLDNAQIYGNSSQHNAADDTIILSDSPPPLDFISLRSGKRIESTPNGTDDSIVIIEDEIPRPIANPKCLRPIVIDGSNVAREHGKINQTFSCKGIKIAIDYFMQRGHTQVTAFVPHYRRHQKYGPVLITDQPLLEELAKGQQVVFTPSRRIDNKRVTCYDDRFVVELATKTGGVILSNDNFRDVAAENEEFKKTVHERLLMFCFVGDIIMIPHDPLGRDGPTLENFLSFPT